MTNKESSSTKDLTQNSVDSSVDSQQINIPTPHSSQSPPQSSHSLHTTSTPYYVSFPFSNEILTENLHKRRSNEMHYEKSFPTLDGSPNNHQIKVIVNAASDIDPSTNQDPNVEPNVEPNPESIVAENAVTVSLPRSKFKSFSLFKNLFYDPLENALIKTDHLSKKSILCWRCISPREVLLNLLLLCSMLALIVFWWLIGYLVFGKDFMLRIDAPLLSLCILIFSAYWVGWSARRLLFLPALLGMMLVGIFVRNIPFIDQIALSITLAWSSTLRSFALCIILLRAGFGLDIKALLRLGKTTMLLACVPCLLECVLIAIPAKFLFGMSFDWAFMLGFVIVAVSPAVIVPYMVLFQERSLGVRKGIPSMVLGSSALEIVLAISGFSILLGIAFGNSGNSSNSLAMIIAHGPIEIVSGVGIGILLGLFMWPLRFLPNRYQFARVLLLLGVTLAAIYGGNKIGYSGSGSLITIIVGICLSKFWTQDQVKNVVQVINFMWRFGEPMLFSLIGSQMYFKTIQLSSLLYGILIIFIGMCVRWIAIFLLSTCCCTGFNLKEIIFLLMVYIPKATVQAALGPVPLSMALLNYDSNAPQIQWSNIILTLAILTTLLTSPIGSLIISISGPLLLKRSDKELIVNSSTKDENDDKDEIILENEDSIQVELKDHHNESEHKNDVDGDLQYID